jgi:hypothetical protein
LPLSAANPEIFTYLFNMNIHFYQLVVKNSGSFFIIIYFTQIIADVFADLRRDMLLRSSALTGRQAGLRINQRPLACGRQVCEKNKVGKKADIQFYLISCLS